MAFQIPTASKDAFKKSFFPQTIRDWNDLPDSLISSAELSDDCVSKFTSLVRARDKSSSANPLVRYCHFGVSPVNYSDSDSDYILYELFTGYPPKAGVRNDESSLSTPA